MGPNTARRGSGGVFGSANKDARWYIVPPCVMPWVKEYMSPESMQKVLEMARRYVAVVNGVQGL